MQRNTVQRRTIQSVFESIERPLTPAEVLDVAQEEAPRMGLATVYRSIRDLLESGWLVAVELPGQTARYERAAKNHHHHFHCRKCGQVFEASGCAKPVSFMRLVPKGFELESHDLTLYGRCLDCLKK